VLPCFRSHGRPPGCLSTSSKILPFGSFTSLPTLCSRKSFRCNTRESPCKCGKQKTYFRTKSFRCNTYKKLGVEPLLSTFQFLPLRNPAWIPGEFAGRPDKPADYSLFLSYTYKCPLPQPLSFDILTNAGGGIPFSAIIPPRTSEAS